MRRTRRDAAYDASPWNDRESTGTSFLGRPPIYSSAASTIGQLLGELAEFRYGWLSMISPKHAEGIPSVVEGDASSYELTAKSMDELAMAFDAGDAAAKRAVLDALDRATWPIWRE